MSEDKVEPEQKPEAVDPKLEDQKEPKDEPTVPKVVKKEHSYTYWVDDKNRSRELPQQHRPKKIQGPVQVDNQQSLGHGPSKWNSLGSWEERAITMKELNETVSEAIQGWLIEKECELKLKEVALEGEFKRIFSNNKRKVLYEISGKISFEGDDLHIKLDELTCTGDQDFKVKGKKKEEKQKLEGVAARVVGVAIETFGRYKE